MAATVHPPVHSTSTPEQPDGLAIGAAARRVGLAPTALRFYEEQGVVTPARGRDGRRRYDRSDLRTLAFVALARELGFGVAAIRSAVRPGPTGWAAAVDEQIAQLDTVIARARRAREILAAARDCPAPSPVHECPHLHAVLDELIDGQA
ncbi:MerR family transcriptional regulator [Pseudonocardia sp. CA-107938]|uniref:MerR family transcriptional regulator n=1 Tax=Pseudonocardia sp. CA-107938 TaxID=3240021 RepID=UPI003D93335F